MPDNQSIRIRGLSKTFTEGDARLPVLRHLDLDIAAGECVALLGRSGSGKSTLLNLLAGIDRPDSGTLLVQGRQMEAMGERERSLFRRRHIGFVYQFFNLIPTLTLVENVRLPLELNGWTEDRIRARTASLLQSLDLADRASAYPDRLSGGEQQRVAIARALAHEPTLVLADEPTGNLDASTGRHMLDLLFGLTRDAGRTLLVVSHSLEVARAAGRLLVLEDGGVRAGDERLAW